MYLFDCRSTARRHLLPKTRVLNHLVYESEFSYTKMLYRGLLPEWPIREHGRVSDNTCKCESAFQLLLRYRCIKSERN